MKNLLKIISCALVPFQLNDSTLLSQKVQVGPGTVPLFLFKMIVGVALVAALFIVSSCSKDEDGLPDNTIRYNGKNYKLDFALGINYGSLEVAGVTYNNTDFFFFDREVDISNPNASYEHGLYLELFSAGSADFQNGAFAYFSGSGSIPSGSLLTEGALFFFDEDEEPVEITGGTITVTITGTVYTFVFDTTTEDGKKLEGRFSKEIEIDNIGEPNISGNVVVGDDSRSADFGEIIDFGVEDSYYNYDFYISDVDESYELYFEAFSQGTSGFQPGTFNYGSTTGSYFTTLEYDDFDGLSFYSAISGSVVVTKLSGAREYRLEFNVVLGDASTLTGTVEGEFRYTDVSGRYGRFRQSEHMPYFKVNRSTIKRKKG